MRRIPLGTLVLAALFLGVGLLLLGLGIGRALRPEGTIIAHEVKDLIAAMQAAITNPFRDAAGGGHGRGPGHAPPILWAAGMLIVAAVGLALRARQQRSRTSRS